MSLAERREMVDREHPSLSLVRQCRLLGVSRSGVYRLCTTGARSPQQGTCP